MIANPVGDDTRFNSLVKGDLAVIEFTGTDYPVSARMVLLSATLPKDATIHHALAPSVGSMAVTSAKALGELLTSINASEDHPIFNLLVDTALEDAALGGSEGRERLFRRRQLRRVSRAELAQARERAGEIGYRGEELVQAHFELLAERGELKRFVWVADQHAVAPYDFEIVTSQDERERVDVKATEGPFERTLHVSLAELHAMADPSFSYRLYRVYDLGGTSGSLRISEPLSEFARILLRSLVTLPTGVSVDGFSLDPAALPFGSPQRICRDDGTI